MEKCNNCQKTVYHLEKLQVSGIILHKTCFKCSKCSMTLRLNNYSKNNGKFFCTPHYKQAFMAKGNYEEGFGLSQHKDKWIQAGKIALNKI